MNAVVFTPVTTGFTWHPPTNNVDGTPIAANEITGYLIGLRADSDTTHSAGNYGITETITDPTATAEPLGNLPTILQPGNYWAAIQTQSTVNGPSAWSDEIAIAIPNTVVPPSPPLPPSSFAAA